MAASWRGHAVECVHVGWFVAVDRYGRRLEATPGDPRVFARSAAKPIQALPLLDTGAAGKLGLGSRHLAICAASHAGEPHQINTVAEILAIADTVPGALLCGRQAPLHDHCAPPGILENNCSGKHAGMLAVCRHQGWDPAHYLNAAHPLQVAIRTRFEQLSDSRLDWATDGCGLPAWQLQLSALALAIARMTADSSGREILDAMRQHPELVAGSARRDTLLMQLTGGRLISKGGAQGVSVGCNPAKGIGWALKIADGSSMAVGPALIGLLESLALIDRDEVQALQAVARPQIYNHAGTRVGEVLGLVGQ